MKKFSNIITVALVVLASFNLVSCSDDDFTPSIFDTTELPLDPTSYTYPLDAFVRDNFLKPYNMKYLYRMEDIGSDMDYNLVPCSYEQSLTLPCFANIFGMMFTMRRLATSSSKSTARELST